MFLDFKPWCCESTCFKSKPLFKLQEAKKPYKNQDSSEIYRTHKPSTPPQYTPTQGYSSSNDCWEETPQPVNCGQVVQEAPKTQPSRGIPM